MWRRSRSTARAVAGAARAPRAGGRRTRVVRRPGRSERSRFRARQRGERPVLPARDQRVGRRTVRLRQRRRPRHLAGAGRQRRSPGPQAAPAAVCTATTSRSSPDGTRTLRFTDVTAASRIVTRGYGQGVAAGDIDNDGWIDLYLTGFRRNQMFRNNGDGTFSDVSLQTGTDSPTTWGVSAAFVDVDRDGWLDLFVGNYLTYSLETHLPMLHGVGTGGLLRAGPLRAAARPLLPEPWRRHSSSTRPRKRAWPATSGRRSACRRPTSTAMAGSTSSSPTTRRKTSCGSTGATAPSRIAR